MRGCCFLGVLTANQNSVPLTYCCSLLLPAPLLVLGGSCHSLFPSKVSKLFGGKDRTIIMCFISSEANKAVTPFVGNLYTPWCDSHLKKKTLALIIFSLGQLHPESPPPEQNLNYFTIGTMFNRHLHFLISWHHVGFFLNSPPCSFPWSSPKLSSFSGLTCLPACYIPSPLFNTLGVPWVYLGPSLHKHSEMVFSWLLPPELSSHCSLLLIYFSPHCSLCTSEPKASFSSSLSLRPTDFVTVSCL